MLAQWRRWNCPRTSRYQRLDASSPGLFDHVPRRVDPDVQWYLIRALEESRHPLGVRRDGVMITETRTAERGVAPPANV